MRGNQKYQAALQDPNTAIQELAASDWQTAARATAALGEESLFDDLTRKRHVLTEVVYNNAFRILSTVLEPDAWKRGFALVDQGLLHPGLTVAEQRQHARALIKTYDEGSPHANGLHEQTFDYMLGRA